MSRGKPARWSGLIHRRVTPVEHRLVILISDHEVIGIACNVYKIRDVLGRRVINAHYRAIQLKLIVDKPKALPWRIPVTGITRAFAMLGDELVLLNFSDEQPA